MAGVSFCVALVAQSVAYAVVLLLTHRHDPTARRRLIPVGVGIVVLALLGAGLRYVPLSSSATAGSVNVGIVQGNVPGRGIEALGRMRSVTNNHLSETINLMVKARLGLAPMPDFILWPENSTDIDPTLDPVTGRTVQAAATLAGRPILVGAVMEGPGPDERQTAALWWDPVAGILARYNKQNLVPFGEWIPFRTQLLPLIPILKEVGAQSVAGTTPGVLTVPLDGRTIKVGDIICFELAYDSTIYSTLRGGAQVLVVQSNNATYGGTGQIEQQFAITRARAMESRREIAVATTNSVSGFIDADGRVVAADEGVHGGVVGGRHAAAQRAHAGGAGRAVVGPGPGPRLVCWPCSSDWAVLARRARRRPTETPVRQDETSWSTGQDSRRPGGSRQMSDDLGRVLVVIPTYNERENIDMITSRLRTPCRTPTS